MLKFDEVFYQESDREIIQVPMIERKNSKSFVERQPVLVWWDIAYQYKVTCWYSNTMKVGITQVRLKAEINGLSLDEKGYTEKHLSEYSSSAGAIRDAIRLFDEAVAEGLPDRGKTEEEAWEEWRESQNPEPRDIPDRSEVKVESSDLEYVIALFIEEIQHCDPNLDDKDAEDVLAELLRNFRFTSKDVSQVARRRENRQSRKSNETHVPRLVPLDDSF